MNGQNMGKQQSFILLGRPFSQPSLKLQGRWKTDKRYETGYKRNEGKAAEMTSLF